MSPVRRWMVAAALLAVGWTAGTLMAAGRGVTPDDWTGKSPEEAAQRLLTVAKDLAGGGSWEHIAVARVHYLAGRRQQAETIFSDYTGDRADETDLLRIARVYMEAGEWDAARPILERALASRRGKAEWQAEIGAYYMMMGDRERAEALFTDSFGSEGVRPQWE